ncbi:hypothetical protein VOLCADRAFT_94583 [Volvox carteri f. nagariensis]|uniref:Uncharacterized protein n=1 Tax=Volvox carteri f. nagariensis TaxID=3068 RepID=D8U563_VOLCA|nr:uncharacterized protein VOLCADRAFT_94583 [Volvox carteri f. nagariensis]EFJ45093.1 hypothetical protein VOLCADRAFT_94583 [Volvox carteri f. nagariensis]|eukprot:XP_002953769.1 hypothetical protein VOLCADRAFT_94583 [Volvox carteri f. nagariensis]
MASRLAVAQAIRAETTGDELIDLLVFAVRMPETQLAVLQEADTNKFIVDFVRQLKAAGSAESTLLDAFHKLGALFEEVVEDNKKTVKLLVKQNKKMMEEIFALEFRGASSSQPKTTVKAGLDINGPENVIPVYDTVGKMLDQQRITIEPTAPGPPIFTVRVLDKSLLQPGQWIVHTDDVCMLWSELDGRVLDFGGMDFGDKGPPLSALLCAIHMRAALLTAENYEWIEKGSLKVPSWAQQLANFPTAGFIESFLRSAAQSALAPPATTPPDDEPVLSSSSV